jgi:hypothetical protein
MIARLPNIVRRALMKTSSDELVDTIAPPSLWQPKAKQKEASLLIFTFACKFLPSQALLGYKLDAITG